MLNKGCTDTPYDYSIHSQGKLRPRAKGLTLDLLVNYKEKSPPNLKGAVRV